MYVLDLNPTYLAMQKTALPESTQFSLKKLCPYMTQPVEMTMNPRADSMPVISWQLAMQIQECRKNHSELKAIRFQAVDDKEGSNGWPVRLDGFDKIVPGKLLLLTANLKRGLGDMILLQPILRAQAENLRKLGWQDRLGLSSSAGFRDLFYGHAFIDEFLTEIPFMRDICKYDYFMEYGISLERMKSLIGIVDWDEIDLKIEIKLPQICDTIARQRFTSDNPKIFLHWESFDKQRTLPFDWFRNLLQEFEGVEFYCSLFGNKNSGELFPGGPKNLWPNENSLRDLFITLKSMDAVVTTNTGIAHAAAALGTPTIVIFSGRLYGWGDYWPRQYKRLYPAMQTIGLEENLVLPPQEIQAQMLDMLREMIPAHELVAA
jgi:hypothetical protein